MPLKVAVVGAGRMGALRSNILSRSPSFTVAVIVDPVAAAGEPLAHKLGAAYAQDPC